MHEPVIIYTTGDRRLEAVASTEHPASSHGLPVLIVDDEPLGPGDLLAGPDRTIEMIRAVETADPEVATALERAGYPVQVPREAAPRIVAVYGDTNELRAVGPDLETALSAVRRNCGGRLPLYWLAVELGSDCEPPEWTGHAEAIGTVAAMSGAEARRRAPGYVARAPREAGP